MADQRLLALANECRERSEEILTKSEAFHDAHAIARMRGIAESYRQLAFAARTGRPRQLGKAAAIVAWNRSQAGF
jgi:hypothetical protein